MKTPNQLNMTSEYPKAEASNLVELAQRRHLHEKADTKSEAQSEAPNVESNTREVGERAKALCRKALQRHSLEKLAS